MLPFSLILDPAEFRAFPGGQPVLRRLSDIRDIFASPGPAGAEDPLVYEFIDLRRALSGSRMSFGLTILQPGTIGGEYYMTRGHFHAAAQDGDELYIAVSGSGLLQLQSRQGEGRIAELHPGAIAYTPLAWAHRTVNTGREPLVFFSIWPAETAYDYEEITRRGGFPQRVVEQDGRPILVENRQYTA